MPASLNVNTVQELVALIKANPGKYNFGSIGNGSLSHLSMEAIALKTGTKMVHIPYPSSPQAMTALMRGDVQMAVLPAIAVTPHVASGAGEDPGDLDGAALGAAAGHADAQGKRHRRRGRRLDGPDRAGENAGADGRRHPEGVHRSGHLRGRAREAQPQLMEAIPTTPAQFRARIEADIARWKPVIEAANIKIN